jgi:hypothetical protein
VDAGRDLGLIAGVESPWRATRHRHRSASRPHSAVAGATVKDKICCWLKDISDAGTGAVISGLVVASIGVAVTVMMASGHAAPVRYPAAPAPVPPVSAGVRPLRPPLPAYRVHLSAAKPPRHKPAPVYHAHAIVPATPSQAAGNIESPLESMLSKLRASGFSGIPGPGYSGWRGAEIHHGTPGWGLNMFAP